MSERLQVSVELADGHSLYLGDVTPPRIGDQVVVPGRPQVVVTDVVWEVQGAGPGRVVIVSCFAEGGSTDE